MSEKMYSVSETVRLVGVESHVLRYWEEELHIEIQRTSQGHRIYSPENIETFRRVKELKGKGIQLKAIRVLLEQSDGQDISLLGQIRKIENLNMDEKADHTMDENESGDVYEIISVKEKPDPQEQFRAILRSLIEEVITEQNQKLEKCIVDSFKTETEDLYLQYYQMIQEAAAAKESHTKRRGRLEQILERFFR